jgi:hypothetical protein
MAINKVVYGGNTLIDLTGDSVTADKMLIGVTAHDKSGKTITGTCDYDVNSTDATATEAEVLKDKTFYARGSKRTGTMPNNGAVSGTISTKDGTYTVPIGYHDGSGKVGIASAEQTKLVPTNIRQGVTILGVTGSMSTTEGEKRQEKTVTPSAKQQIVVPDSGYTCLTSVTVEPIPYVESANSAGGTTVTIG